MTSIEVQAQNELSSNSASASRAVASKKYPCTHAGCDKAFTRSDHLARHALNHLPGKSTCPRCFCHFNRPDLLDRHIARHRQKDVEAGGEGLGVMETRKRLWRDVDGNIVNKRPSLPQSNISRDRGTNVTPDYSNSSISHDTYDARRSAAPISPPRSHLSSDSGDLFQHQFSLADKVWSNDQLPIFSQDTPEMCDFLVNSSWGLHPTPSGIPMGNNSHIDMFNPDTASSFNMPFTTMSNYNWLFDINSFEQDPVTEQPYQQPSVSTLCTPSINGTFSNQFRTSHTQNYHERNGASVFGQSVTATEIIPNPGNISVATHPNIDHGRLSQGFITQRPMESNSNDNSSNKGSIRQTNSNQHDPAGPSQISYTGTPQSESQNTPSQLEELASELDSPQAVLLRSNRHSLPTVDELSRNQILDIIVQAGPRTPDGAFISRDHPLLSLSALQNYSDLFFSRFNICYPLMHQPTFEPSRVEPLLLISVLLLGATYGDKASHRLAVCIHDVMRAMIFQHAAFKAQPELWILQTILLVECFGKSRAGQSQHDMAHLFHGLLINLIRRSDCQTVREPNFEDGKGDLELNWRTFVEIEERKRLSLLCFLWDTQHAVLFSQSLCMSAFELRVSLPCNPATWEADSAEEWYKNYKLEPKILFLAILKGYITLTPSNINTRLNALSRLLVLHGLMSISWDMKRREQTALGFPGPEALERRVRLAESYDTWKADFDTYCMTMRMSLKDNVAKQKDFTQFSTAVVAIYHAAHIILNVEVLDLQIYAGARHIIGRPVNRPDYDRSRNVLKQWAKPGTSLAAVKASWHAAHLLRDGIMNLDNWDVNELFHYPWCLYLATLTLWGFHFAGGDTTDRGSQGSAEGEAIPHDDILWDAQAEMNALVSGMTSVTPEGLWRMVGKYQTRGLTAVMAKYLSSVRWAVIYEGVKVLRGLVPERSINQYESLLR